MLFLILIILLVLVLAGGGLYGGFYGVGPLSLVGVLLLVLILFWLFGFIH